MTNFSCRPLNIFSLIQSQEYYKTENIFEVFSVLFSTREAYFHYVTDLSDRSAQLW